MKQPSDLRRSAREFWGSYKPMRCPGVAVGNFGKDANPAYAFLLIPAGRQTTAYKLVMVALGLSKSAIRVTTLEERDVSSTADVLIRGVRLAETFDPTYARSLLVREGVLIVDTVMDQNGKLTEFGGGVFYWRTGGYHEEPIDCCPANLSATGSPGDRLTVDRPKGTP